MWWCIKIKINFASNSLDWIKIGKKNACLKKKILELSNEKDALKNAMID